MTFIQKVKSYAKRFIPRRIIILIRQRLGNKYNQNGYEIKNYFLSLKGQTDDPELLEIIDYLEKYGFSIFPYDFPQKYYTLDIEVVYDKSKKTRYVIHKNKRLYFPEKWGVEEIRAYYINTCCIEQDKDSPHCYEADKYSVQGGDVIADVGSAEGIWALNCVEKAGKIYLFECDPMWIKALQKTFEPWKDKVVIVNKYVSNVNEKHYTTLDSFFKETRIDFIKADIEGMEIKLLEGCRDMLVNSNNLKLSLCTYHSKRDATEIKEILERNGFMTEYSRGYMLFNCGKKIEKPYQRRGVIRAQKIG